MHRISPSKFEDYSGEFVGLKGARETLVSGWLGEFLGDKQSNPSSAVGKIRFSFLCGVPSYDLVENLLSNEARSFTAICSSSFDDWSHLLEFECERNYREFQLTTRFAFRPWTATPPTQYEIEQELVDCAKRLEVDELDINLVPLDFDALSDAASQIDPNLLREFWSAKQYDCVGGGFGIKVHNQYVAACTSFAACENWLEVEVATHPSFRRRGLAELVVKKMIQHCDGTGQKVCWDAVNQASAKLASKIGFEYLGEYPALRIGKDRRKRMAIVCGSPSPERSISINSARTVYDNLDRAEYQPIVVYYGPDSVDRAYQISARSLYANTTSDFDHLLKHSSAAKEKSDLDDFFRGFDVIFPVMHGEFGEGGSFQKYIEKIGCKKKTVCSDSDSAKQLFDKFRAQQALKKIGLATWPSIRVDRFTSNSEITNFLTNHGRCILKPARGGSSHGVRFVESSDEVASQLHVIRSRWKSETSVLEKAHSGREFTVIVIQNNQDAVALFPLEVEKKDGIHFDTESKYLANSNTLYHCPARFNPEELSLIQDQAEFAFAQLGCSDFLRIDGWLEDDGIYFSDMNVVSGLDTNSLLFIACAQVGLRHRDFFELILQRFATPKSTTDSSNASKLSVSVLFGGESSEKQVSVLSGTNVWQKLINSSKFRPHPALLFEDETGFSVFNLSYSSALFPTVENILSSIVHQRSEKAIIKNSRKRIRARLGLPPIGDDTFESERMSLDEFANKASLVFNALHGGIGENGRLASNFENLDTKTTGSNSEVLGICMDKYLTGKLVEELNLNGVSTIEKQKFDLPMNQSLLDEFWNLVQGSWPDGVIAKPIAEGCSYGVVRLSSRRELTKYFDAMSEPNGRLRRSEFSAGEFSNHRTSVPLPPTPPPSIILERFVETRKYRVNGAEIVLENPSCDWIEATIACVGKKEQMKAMFPSITIAESTVLTLEEKFMKGHGVNFTPPPADIVDFALVERCRQNIQCLGNAIGLSGVARIDVFLNVNNGECLVIEINAIPGMTSSTVLFHQGLAENPPIFPTELLESVLESIE